MTNHIESVQIGIVKIHLPYSSLSYFWISEDLAGYFDTETNGEAEKVIREALRSAMEEKVFKKIKFDSEADAVVIRTNKAEDMLVVAQVVNSIVHEMISEEEIQRIKELLVNHKRPKKQKWQEGDIFSIELSNGTFAFGQVLWAIKYGARGRLDSPTCSLFEKTRKNTFEIQDIINSKVISVLNVTSNGLDSYEWKIIGSGEVKINKDEVPWKHRGEGGIGSKSYTYNVMNSLAEAYHGLIPWNVAYKEDYNDEIMLPSVVRPNTAIILSPNEREAYRKSKGWSH